MRVCMRIFVIWSFDKEVVVYCHRTAVAFTIVVVVHHLYLGTRFRFFCPNRVKKVDPDVHKTSMFSPPVSTAARAEKRHFISCHMFGFCCSLFGQVAYTPRTHESLQAAVSVFLFIANEPFTTNEPLSSDTY